MLVGRDHEVANCVLADNRVSRLHASFDIRAGAICVRDSGSTNGTFVNGERIPHDRWVSAGSVEGTSEIRIAEWTLTIRAVEVGIKAASDDFLTTVPPEPSTIALPLVVAHAGRGRDPSVVTAASGAERYPSASGSSASYPGASPPNGVPAMREDPGERADAAFARAWSGLVGARAALFTALSERLEATPAPRRLEIVNEVLARCPSIVDEPGIRALLERHAGAALPHTLESGSTIALQELARWYVHGEPPLTNAQEAFSFARKLKAGIDELLLGLVPMFAGLDRFEQQMDLRPSPSPKDTVDPSGPPRSVRVPRVPREAARILFNWRDPTDAAVRAFRTDLVDLTMHQVAVLNGVMRGVKQLLAELAPDTLELAWRRKNASRGAFARFFAALTGSRERWALYRERHGDLADEENERFRVIFGPEFVAEYKQSGEPRRTTIAFAEPPVVDPREPSLRAERASR